MAPTKTFNLAGLQTAAIYVPDRNLFYKVRRGINTDEAAEPNGFATVGAITAFTKGGEWLDQLRAYISENRKITEEFIKAEIPGMSVVKSEATYLLWLDISKIGKSREVAAFIRNKTGLFLTAGAHYGECGDGFLRLNIACPKTLLFDGLNRLKKGIKEFSQISLHL